MDLGITLDTVLGTGENLDRKPTEEQLKQEELKNQEEQKQQNGADGVGSADDTDDADDADSNITNSNIKYKDLFFGTDSEEKQKIKQEILTEFENASFDDAGNIIDDENNILVSKEELQKEFDKTEETSIVNEVSKTLGYEIKNENGELKTYSNNSKGISEYVSDVLNIKVKEEIDNFLSSNPTLEAISKHLLSGKTLEEFKEPKDYKSLKNSEISTEEKLQIIRESLKSQNFSDERIKRNLKLIEGSNMVDEEYSDAIDSLIENEESIKQQREQDYNVKIVEQEKETEKILNDVKDKITKGNINNVQLSEKDKKEFFEYVAKPVNNGMTKAFLDKQSMTLEDELFFAFLKFKNLNLSDLVKAQSKNDYAQKIKGIAEKMQKNRTLGNSQKSTNSKKSSGEVVSLSDLL